MLSRADFISTLLPCKRQPGDDKTCSICYSRYVRDLWEPARAKEPNADATPAERIEREVNSSGSSTSTISDPVTPTRLPCKGKHLYCIDCAKKHFAVQSSCPKRCPNIFFNPNAADLQIEGFDLDVGEDAVRACLFEADDWHTKHEWKDDNPEATDPGSMFVDAARLLPQLIAVANVVDPSSLRPEYSEWRCHRGLMVVVKILARFVRKNDQQVITLPRDARFPSPIDHGDDRVFTSMVDRIIKKFGDDDLGDDGITGDHTAAVVQYLLSCGRRLFAEREDG